MTFTAIQHEGKYSKIRISDGIYFALNHIKKYYLLYILCNIPFVLAKILKVIFWFDKEYFIQLIKSLVINGLLLQSVFPSFLTSINVSTWFLSCIMILYLFTPILLSINQVILNKKSPIILIILLVPIIWSMSCLSFDTYHTPIYRVFQYFLGILIYDLSKSTYEMKHKSMWCILALIGEVISYLIMGSYVPVSFMGTIATSVFIYIFSKAEDTRIYEAMSSNLLESAGKISVEIYLLHYPIVALGSIVFKIIFPINTLLTIIEIIFLFIVSLLAAYIYHNRLAIERKLFSIIKNENI